MNFFHFGSLTIPAIWLAVIITLFITPLFFRLLTKKKVEEWYWNGFFLYFVIWKLSYIVFNLKMFLDMPLSILYFNGGTKGNFLALAAFSVYLLLIASGKYRSIYEDSVQIYLLYFICYEVFISLLEHSPIEALCHSILLIGYLIILHELRKKERFLSTQLFIVVLLLEFMIFSLFHSILSIEILSFTWIGITIMFLSFNNKRRETILD